MQLFNLAVYRWLLLLRFIEGLTVGDAWAVFGLELFAYLLHLVKDAKKIAAENLTAVFCGVAALHQCRGDFRKVGGRVHALGQLAVHAIEV